MRWVPSAAVRPNHCACIPFVAGRHPEGFFDFGTEIMAFDGHVYVSVVAAKQMASAMGWGPVVKADDSALRSELENAKLELVQAGEFREAAEKVFESFGKKVPGKPGRSRKVAA